MSGHYAFAGVDVSFHQFASGNMLSQWQWKLNPYETHHAPQTLWGIHVLQKSGSSAVSTEGLVLLRDEPSGFFQRQVYRLDDGGTLWQFIRRQNQKVYLQYQVNAAWDQVELLVDETETAGQTAFEYLGQMVPYLLLPHNILTFHGVLMEYQGKGIIISAASGVGKTTHARLWRDLKHALIINGDRATCRKLVDGWKGYGLPWSGTSGEQINRNVPIQALVVLERGERNTAEVVNGLDAFGKALPHVQCPAWDIDMTTQAMDLFEGFLGKIPVIHLQCRPDAEAVDVLHRVLKENGL